MCACVAEQCSRKRTETMMPSREPSPTSKRRTPLNYASVVSQLWQLQRGQCAECSISLHELQVFDVDHIVPWSVSRCDELWNLQLLCPNCHALKSRQEECKRIARHPKDCCWNCKNAVSHYFISYGLCQPCLSIASNNKKKKNVSVESDLESLPAGCS